MPLIIVILLIVASVLFYQGIYTLRSGQAIWFFLKRTSCAPMNLYQRILRASVYMLSALCILFFLAQMLTRVGIGLMKEWVVVNYGLLLVSVVFLVSGIIYLVKPEKLLRWAIRYNPELWDNKFMLAIVRIISIGFIVISAVILERL